MSLPTLLLHIKALTAEEKQGGDLRSLPYSHAAFPSDTSLSAFFFLSQLPFWVSWHAFLQLNFSHPICRLPCSYSPGTPMLLYASKHLPPWREVKSVSGGENSELSKNIEYFPCGCSSASLPTSARGEAAGQTGTAGRGAQQLDWGLLQLVCTAWSSEVSVLCSMQDK